MTITKLPAGLGVYTEEDFFDRPTCERLKAEMRACVAERATVYYKGREKVLDEAKRSTLKVHVSQPTREFVEAKLTEKLPDLRRIFKLEVTECQEPNFLIYKPGDFFEPHTDLTTNERALDRVKRRAISAVIFLSDEAAGGEPGEYAGGSLAFYGLLGDPRCASLGMPVRGSAGMLVAFRSGVLHQVTPVVRGERFTIVSWFA